jgi:hypothetical protein
MFNLQPPRHISTLHFSYIAFLPACPKPVEADMRAFVKYWGFDPTQTSKR